MAELLVVIRTNGERTVDLCTSLVSQQIGGDALEVIAVKPFFLAVRETFALGARAGADWLLALDADVLLFPGALDYVRRVARTYCHDELLRMDLAVRDKFRGRTCAGAHLYNNRWSGPMVEHLDTFPGAADVLRKESDNVTSFCRPRNLSFSTVFPEWPVGLHDHGQYYRDIVHKYRTRSQRAVVDGNREPILASIDRGERAMPDDLDWRMARAGMEEAAMADADPLALLEHLGVEEKQPLGNEETRELLALAATHAPPEGTCA